MINQSAAIAANNLRSLPGRWPSSLGVVITVAAVVGVLVALLAMAEGFRQTFADAGRSDRIIVLRNNEDNGMASAITREQLPLVLDLPGFAHDDGGRALLVEQKFMTSELYERSTGSAVGVVLRGVGTQAWRVWPEIRIVQGRPFTRGRREAIIGRSAQLQFTGTEIGAEVELANGPWTIVGVFEAPGTLFESELWGDVEMVFPGYSLTGEYSSVVGVLAPDASLQVVERAVVANPRLSHVVKSEEDYYATLSNDLGTAMVRFAYAVAAIIGLGALFAVVNTMYGTVASRTPEIATLRAIGFGGGPLLFSVVVESLALCTAGALVGGLVAYTAFNGYTASTLASGSDLRQVVFSFRVTGDLLLQGLVAAYAVGLLGAMPPAIRAARIPIAEALRKT